MARAATKDRKTKRKIAKKRTLKKQVSDAIDNGKTFIFVEDRPCSVEVNKTAKGDYTFSIKAYVSNEKEMLSVVPTINKIRKEIEKRFV